MTMMMQLENLGRSQVEGVWCLNMNVVFEQHWQVLKRNHPNSVYIYIYVIYIYIYIAAWFGRLCEWRITPWSSNTNRNHKNKTENPTDQRLIPPTSMQTHNFPPLCNNKNQHTEHTKNRKSWVRWYPMQHSFDLFSDLPKLSHIAHPVLCTSTSLVAPGCL